MAYTRTETADYIRFTEGATTLTLHKTNPTTFTVEGTLGQDGLTYTSWVDADAQIQSNGTILST